MTTLSFVIVKSKRLAYADLGSSVIVMNLSSGKYFKISLEHKKLLDMLSESKPTEVEIPFFMEDIVRELLSAGIVQETGIEPKNDGKVFFDLGNVARDRRAEKMIYCGDISRITSGMVGSAPGG